ncbi:MAG: hypothetical protein WBK48_05390 [Dethiobacteria bacterium]|jgi:hypothetical protein|nr:hypothetical protein [Bacillota bacterium]HPT34317.1 hypothetical protein [Bacillota bacterium]HQD06397.1 hypothetical protein [Bacillota bacterium]
MVKQKQAVGKRPGAPSEFMVHLHHAGAESWDGIIEHPLSGGRIDFRSLLEMILLIKEKLEAHRFPQAEVELRTWTSKSMGGRAGSGKRKYNYQTRRNDGMAGVESRRKLIPSQGAPTFFIRIHFCQNASWQGSIQWLEGKSTKFFRSTLEMILLMQEAVEKTGKADRSMAVQSWDEAEEIIS